MKTSQAIKNLEIKLRQLIEDSDCAEHEGYGAYIVNCEKLAKTLAQNGYGDVRAYRAKIIELYLKGNTAELVKFIMEEV